MSARSLSEIAELCGADLHGDGTLVVTGPASLATAGPDQVSFLGHPKYAAGLESTRAAAVLVGRSLQVDRADLNLLRVDDPGRAFTAVIQAFVEPRPAPVPGIHPAATVDPSATIDPTATVGPGCVVEAGATVGARTVLRAQVFVGVDCSLGHDTVVEPNVTLYAGTTVGDRCLIHAGAVIGSDGFGFDPTAQGWVKVPQVGTVAVEDDVEIGANTTIDRARFGQTRIGQGSKIDNLVQVAHNVELGRSVLLVSQSGIAGSTRLGDMVIVAGQAGIGGHVEIASGVRVGGGAGVFGDLLVPGDYAGTPARPRTESMRRLGVPGRVDRLMERMRMLEARLDRQEAGE
ncbi:UDP-3-O-(3-hydroxymyristoyl)glucosamine N-acyltransferase [Engelhardtia mirabilis]|uniref:UDP-3-O-acylglucosamine N-acyltransferase n=1 Tax=Engelhardtia mirabilis TaxID=2528011 RepID=A0A518BPI3_9BACT|nr:UDP-3-O-acylglucosamine N-acyltransferase [Planctomycetes bacterium Pla133]QDV03214.1 UDP-3-O-acylglucosamine N-acyltransferase [Planctomycetes bacterium Pla86]